ncbi:MAG: hypothetical protein EP330_03335 [Deltaproteobacteria bacterium]|nr:MAG: hypothetical protein EP330_03335 [Deltaproteobacteria bacterium]
MPDELHSPRLPASLTLVLALAASGCAVDADYTLTLVPRTLPSQDVFAGEVEVKALLRGVDNAVEIPAKDAENLRPLDGDHVGIVVETVGGAYETFNRFRMTAYGEIGPISLSAGGREDTFEVFVSSFGVVGEMDTFPEAHHLAAAAMFPRGGVVVAGGGDIDSGATDDGVYWMRHPDTADWRLERVASLPGPRAGASADIVEIDGIHRVLIAGGRSAVDDVSTNRPQAMLFDPLEARLGWQGELAVRRSEHASVVLDNGKVLLVGGWTDDGSAAGQATFEIFDPATKTLTPGATALDMPSVGLSAASLGPDGALVCGGGALSGSTFTPSATCNRITLTGQVLEAASMLGPRMGHALLRLADDSVLLTGGVDQTVTQGTPAQGITTASLYIPREDEWQQIGPMELRRVGHKLVPTGDGRYLAVGGSELADFDLGFETPRDCTELFDPATFQWTVLTPCDPTGRGAAQAVASRPDQGAFVLTGYDPAASSGRTYGWIGFGPPIPAAE